MNNSLKKLLDEELNITWEHIKIGLK